MSDCDNCIYTEYIENELICLKGYKIDNADCVDFEHWNTLTDEERRTPCKP